jgi:hypothetical protein
MSRITYIGQFVDTGLFGDMKRLSEFATFHCIFNSNLTEWAMGNGQWAMDRDVNDMN